MIETPLPGHFPPSFTATGRINLSQLMREHKDKGYRPQPFPTTRVEDARPLQEGRNEAEFLVSGYSRRRPRCATGATRSMSRQPIFPRSRR